MKSRKGWKCLRGSWNIFYFVLSDLSNLSDISDPHPLTKTEKLDTLAKVLFRGCFVFDGRK
ncbi:hypothetical protein A2318_04655 [Candidatus Uhrbacteria bacterium RIFOXYB2_FULL_45_11]|uniref:Uncharacterized protein n=1 Tax=Candidatus Uhrbacteria bacterium RIFOXYB2_FULL_45_11 TaxID=1802421 RepID=A0A1F7W2Q1_9BACT|nr:MAG: hypothetical protein A2318_04655 [Candidatus Uhrbacteria bacterium RIFOXYB2_FULL_45_11]